MRILGETLLLNFEPKVKVIKSQNKHGNICLVIERIYYDCHELTPSESVAQV